MRNRITLVIALMAISFISKAQLFLGTKVGINIANISANYPNMAFNKKIGINGGLALKYKFTKAAGAQMDILYSQMGSKAKEVTVTDDGAGGTATLVEETLYDFSYLQIPLFANFEIPIRTENLIPYRLTESVVSVHFCLGGYFGYAIGHKATVSAKTTTLDVDGNTTIVVDPKTTIPDDPFFKFNSIDFGLAFGAGFSIKLSDRGRFTVDGRYLMGMGNFNSKGAYLDTLPFTKMKNKAPQIQLGYIHRISKLKRWHLE